MTANTILALMQEAVALHRRGALAEAADRYQSVLRQDPTNTDALYLLGTVSFQAKRYADALGCLQRAIALRPQWAAAHHVAGLAHKELGRFPDALASFTRAVEIEPGAAQFLLSRANALNELGRFTEAAEAYAQVCALKPDLPEAWHNRSHALLQLLRAEEALASIERALALQSNAPPYQLQRANCLRALGRNLEAVTAYERLLAIPGAPIEVRVGLALTLQAMGRHTEALASCDGALAAAPLSPDVQFVRGFILAALKRHDEALLAYERAVALKPDHAEAWLCRGNVLAEFARYDEALTAYERAAALKPDLAEAWVGRGNIMTERRQHAEAVAAYHKAFTISPALHNAEGSRLHAKLQLCDWADLDAEISHLLAAIRDGKAVSQPFALLPIPASPADQLQCARRYTGAQPVFPPLCTGGYAHERIRVAYVSADFHEHATAYLMAGLFEQHDRSRFEWTALSFGPDRESPMRGRLRSAFDRFLDVRAHTDQEIAAVMRSLEIDVAVDLKGFTTDSRPSVFARRPAPIQASYLGYPGTMGASFIDYIIADPVVIPTEHFPFYDEKVVWLPDSYQVNDAQRPIAERAPTRRACGLPETGFVFCCLNAPYKILPEAFDVWMRLLAAVDDSVLWLLDGGDATVANLRGEARKRGVKPERLIFADSVPLADHLARYRQADLFLDTWPYNAHTTASDALWAGLPVLTLCGATFAGRVAASLLRAVGLSELIAPAAGDYETLALALAHDPARLAAIKTKLARQRDACPLFDTKRSARHLESAYVTMVERHRRGEALASFAVEQRFP